MLSLILIAVLALMACGKVMIQGNFSRQNLKTVYDGILYNAVTFLLIALFLALFFEPQRIDSKTLLWGATMGVLTALFQISYTYALKTGPVSLTVLICNFNVLIVSVFCIVVFRERLYLSGLLGVFFLIVSMFLSLKKENDRVCGSIKWLIAVLISLVTSGFATCIQKAYTVRIDATNTTAFLVCAYAAAFFVAGAAALFTKPKERESGRTKTFLLHSLATAAVLAVYQKLFMYIMSTTPGSFFSPTYAGMQSVIMSVIGVFFFRDNLNNKQKLGIFFGVLCVIFMNLKIIVV